MKRIAVVAHCRHRIEEPFAGGLEMHTLLLCRELVALGHEVTLFAREGTPSDGFAVQPVVPTSFAFNSKLSDRAVRKQDRELNGFYRSALAFLDERPFDAVINNSFHSEPVARTFNLPQLNVLHTPPISELLKVARRAAADPLKAFVTVSESNAASWRPKIGPVHTVLNGIDVEQWPSTAQTTDELRWSARITPEKGLHDAITAARMAGRDLKVAGPLSDIAYFDEVIRPQLGKGIEYVGHLSHSELPAFYGSGAVTLVTPLWPEPFGLVVAESIACGTPVVAYDRGAMAELVTPSVGVMAWNNTPAHLAAAVESAAMIDRDGCRREARSRFSISRMAASYLAILDGVVASNEPEEDLCAG